LYESIVDMPTVDHPITRSPGRPSPFTVPPYHWWRTVFFLIPAISVYTVVLGAASIVSSLFDRRGHFAHRCARAWSWLILKTTGVRVTLHGLERITPGTTYVFVSNHQSIYDIPVIFASLPYQLRIIAKASLARFPVLGWHLARGGHLFVDRRKPDHGGILTRWRALVSEGLSLIIFAEGTRSWDGRVARFKAGSFLLAIEAGLPIVPLAVIGTRQVMPKGRLRTEPASVELVVHDPIQPPAIDHPTVHDAKTLADRVHAVVAATVAARQFPAA
jgi:1-acyl-sn-glycerol-3-phosphate acyltransferase